jgi:tRNA1(Val) A37 N6-methylase TrmN6
VIEEDVKEADDVKEDMKEVKEEEDKDVPLINPMTSAKFGRMITKENPEYEKFVIGKASEYSVLKPWHISQVDDAFHKWFPQKDAIQYIVDGTAHVGVDSWHFSNYFEKAIIHSYEVVPLYYAMLELNIKTLGKTGRIIPHFGDISQWNPEETVDLLFVDPPWGSNFDTKKNMDLYLQAEDETPDESKNVINLIQKWINTQMITNIILKTPSNYNFNGLRDKFNYEEVIIKSLSKKADKIAFTLLLIRNPTVMRPPIEEVKDNRSDAAPSLLPINAAPANAPISVPVPKKKIKVIQKYKSAQMYRFGITGKLVDTLEIGDPHAAKYLSLSIPFSITDRTDPAIIYPTIEHYIMAMKIKYASNNQEACKELSITSRLHQKFIKHREKTKVNIQTDADYSLIATETAEIKKLFTKFANSGTIFDENEWNYIAKKHLEYALELRFKEDERFHTIVEKAREKKLYMLYMSEIENNKLGTSLVEKDIKGENLVGITLMELAGFEF